ncbi:hypothetical protein [Staphylococcus pseudintermedius]|uniref:hypothetical protein n=1 Tax=Staphylococcus pseudintermedius TaxID=283734 RepID=UPI00286E342A|nr:hypothetical protein [Staphylococcus pseudintermedius]WMZ43038.1 hypothetical protein QS427_12915 [Staphylococcus pseudintermedius]
MRWESINGVPKAGFSTELSLVDVDADADVLADTLIDPCTDFTTDSNSDGVPLFDALSFNESTVDTIGDDYRERDAW